MADPQARAEAGSSPSSHLNPSPSSEPPAFPAPFPTTSSTTS